MMILNSLSLSLSFTHHTQKKRKEVSLSFSLSPLARAPTRRKVKRMRSFFSRLRKQHRSTLTFVCLCVLLVFEETKTCENTII